MSGSFSKVVRKFQELAGFRIKARVIAGAVGVAQRAAELTPVDTSAAQSRWSVAVGDGPAPPLQDNPGLGPDGVAARARKILEGVKAGRIRIRVYNDSPYINVLEYGDGTKPPHFMLRRAMMEFKGFVEGELPPGK